MTDENGNDQHDENGNDRCAYIVFDGKHNGRHKDRCIADGCLTNTSADTTDLLPSQYDLALQDDVNGELYFDALKDIDSDLDKYGRYVNVGDFTFSDNDPLSVSWDPDQGSTHDHGERIY